MDSYKSGDAAVRMEAHVPAGGGRHPALLVLHGSGGAASWWLERFAPPLAQFGVGLYAPHYFDRTGTARATAETILDGRHFPAWLEAVRDAVRELRLRPGVDPARIGVLGVSLGGYLAIALALAEPGLKLAIEISGGIPPGWEERVSPEMPPVLVLHGGKDDVVPVAEAEKLAGLLRERKVRHQVQIFPEEGHWFSGRSSGALLMSCGAFLAQNLMGGSRG